MIRNVFAMSLLSLLVFGCAKDKNEKNIRELSPLGKKLIGKWMLLSFNPAPGDYWRFEDHIVESISNDSVVYRSYIDSVKQSFCNRFGKWYEKDSVLYGTCVPAARIVKLTNDSLIFTYGGALTYKWVKAK